MAEVIRKKDVLLEHISRDIKGLHKMISDTSTVVDMVTANEREVQALCEHMDTILLHGVRELEDGYWPMVSYFTRSDAIRTINGLENVTSNIARGRAWLYMALNEQAMESYVRMFIENQDVIQEYYLRESFLRDIERLIVLQTLVAGLDMVTFDLDTNSDYFEYGAVPISSQLGIARSSELTPDVLPSFISSVTPESRRRLQMEKEKNKLEDIATEAKPQPPSSARIQPPPLVSREEEEGDKKKAEVEVTVASQPVESPIPQDPASHSKSLDPGSGASVPSHSKSLEPGSGANVLERMSSVPSDERKETQQEVGGDDLVEHVSSSKARHKKSKGKKKKRKKKTDVSKSDDVEQRTDSPLTSQPTPPEPDQTQPEGTAESHSITVESHSNDHPTEAESHSSDAVSHPTRTELDVDDDPHSILHSRAEEAPISLAETRPLYDDDDIWSMPVASKDDDVIENVREKLDEPDGAVLLDTPPSQSADVSTPSQGSSVHLSPSLPVNSDLIVEAIEECEPRPRDEASNHHGNKMKTDEKGSPQLQHIETESLPSNRLMSPDFEIISPTEVEEKRSKVNWTPPPPPSEPVVYDSSPSRPRDITEADRTAADVRVNDNTKLVFSLDILYTDQEEIIRLVQIATPSGVGQQRSGYVLITNTMLYLIRKEGLEGQYSREFGIEFCNFEHIVIGLSWQSLILVYHESMSGATRKCVLLTGSEAVSKSLVDTIRSTAASCPGFMRSIPLNKDDESRIDAIEKELIKLGSQTNMEIVSYSLANWEQVSGELPEAVASEASRKDIAMEGSLLCKSKSGMFSVAWKPAYFVLKSGRLFQYGSDLDTVAKSIHEIRNSQGCTRTAGEAKPYTFQILGTEGPMLTLAASNEEELTQWLQALCEAVLEKELPGSPIHRKTCLSCALLLTQNKIHVLQEDWSNESVQLITSCEVQDINDISVDSTLPLYCTISYDSDESQGVWLVCFNSEFELGRFELALGSKYRDIFQVSLSFNEVRDPKIRRRAHKAVELMQGSRFRSDSVTRGRTEITYTI